MLMDAMVLLNWICGGRIRSSIPFVNPRSLLEVGFALGVEGLIDPSRLSDMDYSEVIFYNDRLAVYLAEKMKSGQ